MDKLLSGFLQILESANQIKSQCSNYVGVAAFQSRAPSQLVPPSLSQLLSHPGQMSGEMFSSIMHGVFLINTVQYHFVQEILQLAFLSRDQERRQFIRKKKCRVTCRFPDVPSRCDFFIEACHQYTGFVSFITDGDVLTYSQVLFLRYVIQLFPPFSGEN